MRIFIENNEDIVEYWGDVTDIFKEYLGDIVKFAKVLLITDYNLSGIEVTKDMAKNELNKMVNGFHQNGIFHFDATKVIITFTNDKGIEVRNSEWGSFCKGE